MKQFPKYDYRKEKPIDTEYTLECPNCGYMLIGKEPRISICCEPCADKIYKHNKNALMRAEREQDAKKS